MKDSKSFGELKESVQKRREQYLIEKGQEDQILKSIEKRKEKISKLEKEISHLRKVDLLLKQASEYARSQFKEQLEYLITSSLQSVFQKELSFHIELFESHNSPGASFLIEEEVGDERVYYDPLESRGGGLVDMISIILRIAFLYFLEPKIEGPLLLDEPAKHLSDEYVHDFANFLKSLTTDLDLQILLVTHNDHFSFMADKIYKTDFKNHKTTLEELE